MRIPITANDYNGHFIVVKHFRKSTWRPFQSEGMTIRPAYYGVEIMLAHTITAAAPAQFRWIQTIDSNPTALRNCRVEAFVDPFDWRLSCTQWYDSPFYRPNPVVAKQWMKFGTTFFYDRPGMATPSAQKVKQWGSGDTFTTSLVEDLRGQCVRRLVTVTWGYRLRTRGTDDVYDGHDIIQSPPKLAPPSMIALHKRTVKTQFPGWKFVE
ncbi:MAG: hypothetical protein ACR2RL_13025 [Gammaproteobacteria bacterium]